VAKTKSTISKKKLRVFRERGRGERHAPPTSSQFAMLAMLARRSHLSDEEDCEGAGEGGNVDAVRDGVTDHRD